MTATTAPSRVTMLSIGQDVAAELTNLTEGRLYAATIVSPKGEEQGYPTVFVIDAENGDGYWLVIRHRDGRFHVSGEMTAEAEQVAVDNLLRREEPKPITMADTVPGTKIARDTFRRFLPAYVEWASEVLRRLTKRQTRQAAVSDIGNELIIAAGDADWLDPSDKASGHVEIGRHGDTIAHGAADISPATEHAPARVKLTLNLSPEDARAVLQHVRERHETGGQETLI